ncbi:hypothetical protein [Piscinibacter koreensis]|uniref:Uncharacterized protein n=1 Tax=Piscinibacter koreensis TaxID=2742824 RepID=A0A7Y6NKU6_9BURK|nr:hypothetical protein [Schlegelella koreensis]NUZ05022.1 hypothetical protein [Schlegelella koreensis]
MKKSGPEAAGAFEQRLAALRAAHAPQFEIDAAVAVCERLRTARAVCDAVLADSYSESAVLTVLDALSDEVAALQQYAFDADPPPKGFAQ